MDIIPLPEAQPFCCWKPGGFTSFPERPGLWKPEGRKKFIGTVTGMKQNVELTWQIGEQAPAHGSLVHIDGPRATLTTGPGPLPRRLTILAEADDVGILQVPICGSPHESGVEELMAMVAFRCAETPEAIRKAVDILTSHYHFLVFDFGVRLRPAPRPQLLAKAS